MTTTPLPRACIAGLADDHRIIRGHLLPRLSTAVWDLERHHAAGDDELAALRGEVDELQTDIAIHLGEEAEFLMPLIRELAADGPVPVEDLDQLETVMASLRARRDDFARTIATIRDSLAAGRLDHEAEDLREEIDELLLELRARLTRHDRAELEELFPAAEEAIHDRLVDRDRAEDRARGWEVA